jgi:hypothetical protein
VSVSKSKMLVPLHFVMQLPNTLKKLDQNFLFKNKMPKMNVVNMVFASSTIDDGCE